MQLQTFLNYVKQMRQFQKAYFRQGRKSSDLMEAKKFEALVDSGLAEGVSVPVEENKIEQEQPTLFSQEPRNEITEG
jgi:hypothetical protein